MLLTAHASTVQQSWLVNLALRLNRPLARLLVLSGITLSLFPLISAEMGQAATPATRDSARQATTAQSEVSAKPTFPANGVYVYGEAPTADQLGRGYMVFEAVDQQLVGALYYPQSSFDCFHGQVQNNALAMEITNSYSQEKYPYEIALATEGAIASNASDVSAPFSLDGFYQLPTPSANDLRMLEVCKAQP